MKQVLLLFCLVGFALSFTVTSVQDSQRYGFLIEFPEIDHLIDGDRSSNGSSGDNSSNSSSSSSSSSSGGGSSGGGGSTSSTTTQSDIYTLDDTTTTFNNHPTSTTPAPAPSTTTANSATPSLNSDNSNNKSNCSNISGAVMENIRRIVWDVQLKQKVGMEWRPLVQNALEFLIPSSRAQDLSLGFQLADYILTMELSSFDMPAGASSPSVFVPACSTTLYDDKLQEYTPNNPLLNPQTNCIWPGSPYEILVHNVRMLAPADVITTTVSEGVFTTTTAPSADSTSTISGTSTMTATTTTPATTTTTIFVTSSAHDNTVTSTSDSGGGVGVGGGGDDLMLGSSYGGSSDGGGIVVDSVSSNIMAILSGSALQVARLNMYSAGSSGLVLSAVSASAARITWRPFRQPGPVNKVIGFVINLYTKTVGNKGTYDSDFKVTASSAMTQLQRNASSSNLGIILPINATEFVVSGDFYNSTSKDKLTILPYTCYRLELVAVGSQYQSSDSMDFCTSDAAPRMIRNLTPQTITATRAQFYFQDPNPVRGVVLNYTAVICDRTDVTQPCRTQVLAPNDKICISQSLAWNVLTIVVLPYTSYSLSIAAETIAGRGPMSNTTFDTLEAQLAAPVNVKATAIDAKTAASLLLSPMTDPTTTMPFNNTTAAASASATASSSSASPSTTQTPSTAAAAATATTSSSSSSASSTLILFNITWQLPALRPTAKLLGFVVVLTNESSRIVRTLCNYTSDPACVSGKLLLLDPAVAAQVRVAAVAQIGTGVLSDKATVVMDNPSNPGTIVAPSAPAPSASEWSRVGPAIVGSCVATLLLVAGIAYYVLHVRKGHNARKFFRFPDPDIWERPRNEFERRALLGKGAFGTVFEGRWKMNGENAIR